MKTKNKLINDTPIPDSKAGVDAQLQNELLFKTLFELSPDAMILIDPHDPDVPWSIADCNTAACQMNGYTREELVGQPIDIVNAPTNTPIDRSEYLKQLRELGTVKYEIFHRRKDGTLFPVEVSTTLIKVGAREFLLGIDRDISERKRLEAETRDNEEKLRAIYEGTHDAIMLLNEKGFFDCNPQTLKMFGFKTNEEFTAVHPADVSPAFQPDGQESLSASRAHIQTAYRQGYDRFEWVHRRTNGEEFPAEVLLSAFDFGGQRVLQATVRDITERKRAEAATKEERQRFQTILETIRVPTLISRLSDGVVIYANEALAEVSQVNLNKLIGFKTGSFYANPDDRNTVLESLRQHGHIEDFEVQFRRTDGSKYWALLSSRIINYEGEACVLSSYVDITQRKRAEADLLLRDRALASSLNAVLVAGLDFRPIYVNEAFLKMTGYTYEEAMQLTITDLSAYPEGLKRIDEATHTQGFFVGEEPIKRKDGSILHTDFSTSYITDAEGKPIAIQTSFFDITERKRLETQVQEAFERRGLQVQLSTQVSQSIATASSLEELYERVVTQVKEQFGYYHTQLLRYDPTREAVVLIIGYGEIGTEMLAAGHRMPMGEGLIGTAAATGETVLRPTLENDPDWHPNPLLPETKGEIAVPIKLGETVLGVLDVQSNEAGALDTDDQLLLEGLCGQIATAIESTRLREEMTERLEEISRLYRTMSREGWQAYRQTANIPTSFMFDQAGLRPTQDTRLAEELFAKIPLAVPGGEVIGTLAVADDPQLPISPEDQDFLQQVSEQVALALESARLFEQTVQQRGQLDEALDIAGLANWEYDVKRDRFLFNDHFYAIFHTTVEQVGGYEVSSAEYAERFVHPDDRGMVGAEIGKALSSTDRHYNVQLEHRILFADGGTGYISVNVHIERDEQGNITRYYGANQDITERKRAEIVIQESRAALGEAMDIAKLANWEYDVNRDRFIFNDHFYSIFHTTVEQVGGYEVSSAEYAERFVHPDDRPMVGAEIGKALSSKDRHYNVQLEHRILFADGGVGYISVNVHIERDEQGNITRYYGANQDITERKLAERAIAKRATELATVAQVSTTTSTMLDPDKLLQTVVDLTKERFGLYHAHVYVYEESWNTLLLAAGAGEVGRKLVAEEHAIPMSIEQSLVARAARERKPLIVNDVSIEPGFLPNPLLPETRAEIAVPMTVGDKLLGVFDVQSNRTEGFSEEDANIYVTLASQVGVALQNARLYVEQAALVTQLRELDRLKSSFLANMSHELRTPLNSILGFADVIIEELDGPLTENMSNDLRLIQKNGQHLLHLINDVLDMAKIEAGRMNLNPESFRAYEVLEEVTSITSTLASEKNLALFIHPDSEQDVSIYADRTRLRQVMINLVNNAIKFTENGNIAIKLDCIPGARILITVKDTGIGIPPDKLEAIFLEFTQVDSSSTRKAGGTGLGLPISRKLVEMHGGRLWAESTGIPGEGSTFFVELPLEARLTETVEKQAK